MIGSHNTMSYLRPRRWWGRLLRVFARCQALSLDGQIKAGVRAFDLRIYRDPRTGGWLFAHGLVSFDTSETLQTVISRIPAGAVVRIILERDRGDGIPFDVICSRMERDHPELTFIGGRRKRDWKKLHRFAGEDRWPDSTVHQHVGSMAPDARWYERLIPLLYARRVYGYRKTPRHHILPDGSGDNTRHGDLYNLPPLLPGINLFDFIPE